MSSSVIALVVVTTVVLVIGAVGLSAYYAVYRYAHLEPEVNAVKTLFRSIAMNIRSGGLKVIPIEFKFGCIKFEDEGILSVAVGGQRLFASKLMALTYECDFQIYPMSKPVILEEWNHSGLSCLMLGLGSKIKLYFYPKVQINGSLITVTCVVFEPESIKLSGSSLKLNYDVSVFERCLAPLQTTDFELRVVCGAFSKLFLFNASALNPSVVSVKVVKVVVEG